MAEPRSDSKHSLGWLIVIIPSGYVLGSMLREAMMPCRMRAREAARRLVETDPRGNDGTVNVTQATNYNQVNQNQNMDAMGAVPVSGGNGGNRFDNSNGMSTNTYNV